MRAVIFMGIQATGKSSFYKEFFIDSHPRINRDMIGKKGFEKELASLCFGWKVPFVVDMMNLTCRHREWYLVEAAKHGYEKVGYYFSSNVKDAIRRNKSRENQVPEAAIPGCAAQLELPTYEEGFDQLFYVRLDEEAKLFIIDHWRTLADSCSRKEFL